MVDSTRPVQDGRPRGEYIATVIASSSQGIDVLLRRGSDLRFVSEEHAPRVTAEDQWNPVVREDASHVIHFAAAQSGEVSKIGGEPVVDFGCLHSAIITHSMAQRRLHVRRASTRSSA